MTTERRSIGSELADIGVEQNSNGLSGIKGYAAIYYDGSPATEFRFGKTVERILPGAFSRSLNARDDVVALFNHNSDFILGRRSAKTLRLYDDEKGLRYSIDTPSTTVARDLVELISRGDVKGSSFSFSINGHEGESWRSEGETMIRELRDLHLYDISPVTNPAYGGTSVDLRNAFQQWEARKIGTISVIKSAKIDIRRRIRLIELESGLPVQK